MGDLRAFPTLKTKVWKRRGRWGAKSTHTSPHPPLGGEGVVGCVPDHGARWGCGGDVGLPKVAWPADTSDAIKSAKGSRYDG